MQFLLLYDKGKLMVDVVAVDALMDFLAKDGSWHTINEISTLDESHEFV